MIGLAAAAVDPGKLPMLSWGEALASSFMSALTRGQTEVHYEPNLLLPVWWDFAVVTLVPHIFLQKAQNSRGMYRQLTQSGLFVSLLCHAARSAPGLPPSRPVPRPLPPLPLPLKPKMLASLLVQLLGVVVICGVSFVVLIEEISSW